jgi:hypothetical protein
LKKICNALLFHYVDAEQGCQIFLGATYQNGKKYAKTYHIISGRKIVGLAIKYNNIFHCKTLQNLPKLGFLV